MERSKMEKNLEQLKHSIATGEMTGSELVRRLQMMIQQEISKPEKEVDTEFIEACSSLIEIVYPDITKRPEGYYEEQEAKFKLRLRQREQARKRQRISRPAIAVAAVLVIVFLSVGSLRFHWFTAESTPDQQQLIIQGHEVSVDMVAKAIAEHQEEGFFQTDDIASLKELLGFDLDYLNLVSSEWKIDNTSTIINQDYIMTTLHYSKVNDSNKSFRYVISWYLNPEDASYSIEQKKKGYVREYNNIEVYFLDNTNSCSCCWIAGTSVHVITSSLDARTLEKITEILLGDQHEKSNNTSIYFSVYSSYI